MTRRLAGDEQCIGKRAYPTSAEAKLAIHAILDRRRRKHIKRKGPGWVLAEYRCAVCNKWHLG